jgi:hypothetical protein
MALEDQVAAPEVAGTAIPGETIPEASEAPESTTPQQQTSSVEDRAREQGWKPKEEYEGDPTKWVSAETFVAKGELIERIEALGKKLKDSEKAVKMLTEHHSKVKETEFKRAIEFLKAQKKQAYENGDVDKIIEMDDKIAEVRETQKAQKAAEEVEEAPELHPDFVSWVSDNKWYKSNNEMKAEADAIGQAYATNHPDVSPEKVLEYVTGRIKKLYPEEFQNQNRNRPSSVEGGSGRQAASSEAFSLTEEEKKVMNTFIRNGVMTKEEYMKEVKAMRGA